MATYKTHSNVGFMTIGAILSLQTDLTFEQIFASTIIAGMASILPDLDSENSIASQMIWLVDDLLRKIRIKDKKLVKHRGIMHFNIDRKIVYNFIKNISNIFEFHKYIKNKINIISKIIVFTTRWLISGILLYYSFKIHWIYGSFIIGYVSHIIIDYIMTYLKIKTGSETEIGNKIFTIYNITGFFATYFIIINIVKILKIEGVI